MYCETKTIFHNDFKIEIEFPTEHPETWFAYINYKEYKRKVKYDDKTKKFYSDGGIPSPLMDEEHNIIIDMLQSCNIAISWLECYLDGTMDEKKE